jgi:hypothetical protein
VRQGLGQALSSPCRYVVRCLSIADMNPTIVRKVSRFQSGFDLVIGLPAAAWWPLRWRLTR